jgi:hypothetical protein
VGLDAVEAGEFPVGDDHLLDEGFLEAADGAVLFTEGLENTEESVFVLTREESGAGAEAVGEGVASGDGFSGLGFGASGAESVAAVGVDLLLSGHKNLNMHEQSQLGACGANIDGRLSMLGSQAPGIRSQHSTHRVAEGGAGGGAGQVVEKMGERFRGIESFRIESLKN